jgi:hypothetical protein
MSGLKEKVVYVEKRYCETCDSWTETPATYCKQCGSKLTYSPQKCSTDLVRFEDVEQEIGKIENEKRIQEKFLAHVSVENEELKQKLQLILENIKSRDRWDSKLSPKTNYRLLQERYEQLEKIVEELLKEEKAK